MGMGISKRLWQILPLGGLLLIAFYLRVEGLLGLSPWVDEAISFRDSGSFNDAIRRIYHPPLFNLLLYLWRGLFGDDLFVMRLLSVFFGTAGVALVYFIVKDLTRRAWPAWFAGFFYALLPIALVYSRELRGYSLWSFCFLLAIWGLLGFRENQIQKRRLFAFWGGGLLGALSHHYMAFYLLGLCIASGVFLFRGDLKKASKKIVLFNAPFLVCAGFVLVIFSFKYFDPIRAILKAARWGRDWGGFREFLWAQGGMIQFRHVDFRLWAAETGMLTMSIAVLSLISLLFLDMKKVQTLKNSFLNKLPLPSLESVRLFVSFSVLFFLPVLLISILPIRHEHLRYFVPTSGALAVLIGILIHQSLRILPRKTGEISTVIVSSLLLVNFFPEIDRLRNYQIEDWSGACEFVAQKEKTLSAPSERQLIILNEASVKKVFNLCYQGEAVVTGYPISRKKRPRRKELQEFASQYDSVFLIYSHAWTSDKGKKIRKFFKENFEKKAYKKFYGANSILVYHFKKRTEMALR